MNILTSKNAQNSKANVCLILEGTYPYVAGGVSSWAYELLKEQNHLTFHILAILPPGPILEPKYEIPDNVISLTNVILQELPEKTNRKLSQKERNDFFQRIEAPLLNLQTMARMKDLKKVLKLFGKYRDGLSREVLLNSQESWRMLTRMYNSTLGNSSFLDYFWSWRALFGSLFSLLHAPIMEADCYHSLCTGYSGLYMTRVWLETGKPSVLTEHGIYTNERRIEIASADWLNDQQSLNFNLEQNTFEKDLRDLWIDSFINYSKLCYESSSQIITLYEGNQELQIDDGADPEKLSVIPNGIDYDHFAKLERKTGHPPTVALIGRVVPIKDVKTFIRSVSLLNERIADLRVWIMGPTDEDKDYYHECRELVEHGGMESVITFTGKVNLADYLGEVDVLVLSSLSEAQPLVILEVGAAGIPSVATRVGACQELIYGRNDEDPPLGEGGVVCSLSSPIEIADALERLLNDSEYYEQCSQVIRERVKKYYNKKDQHEAYRNVYALHIN